MPYLCLTAVYPWIIGIMASPILQGLLPSAEDEYGFGKLIGYPLPFGYSPQYI
jgi:hypothetical protein